MNLPAPPPTPDDPDGSSNVDRPTPATESARPATESARPALTRRQLDEIFGDVLPTVTRDELDDGRDQAVDDDRERWYRDNQPPHHG